MHPSPNQSTPEITPCWQVTDSPLDLAKTESGRIGHASHMGNEGDKHKFPETTSAKCAKQRDVVYVLDDIPIYLNHCMPLILKVVSKVNLIYL